MKKIFQIAFFIITIVTVFSFSPPESIYNISFNDINGNAVNMNQFHGKKILIMTIPVNQADTAVLNQLTGFQNKYKDSISVIGILSVEDGYKDENKAAVKALYKETWNLNLLIAEGMHTRKTGDNAQSSLIMWLTQKNRNLHFDKDVSGVGQKFFIDEDGDLYAVIGPEIPLTHRVIDKIVNRPRRLQSLPPLSDQNN